MTSLFSRRLMAWLLALAVIVGASPIMAASFGGDGPGVSQAGNGLPTAPIQVGLEEGFNPAIEDESSRRLADHGNGDLAFMVAAELAVTTFGIAHDTLAEPRSWRAAGVLSSRLKTGPPTV